MTIDTKPSPHGTGDRVVTHHEMSREEREAHGISESFRRGMFQDRMRQYERYGWFAEEQALWCLLTGAQPPLHHPPARPSRRGPHVVRCPNHETITPSVVSAPEETT